MSTRSNISCGRDLTCVADLSVALQSYGEKGYDFISVPLVHPRYKREYFRAGPKRSGPLTRSDRVISVSEWSSLIVAKLSPWIRLDSNNEAVRRNSEKAFFEEISLAVHLSTSAIFVPLRSMKCENLARCLNRILLQSHHHIIWVHVKTDYLAPEGLDSEAEAGVDSWEMWNKLRTLCGNHHKLGLALELVSEPFPLYKMNRWCGEPLKLVVLPTSIFVRNKKGYPVLSKSVQTLLQRFFKLNAQFLLSGACGVDFDISTYQQYLNHIYQSRPVYSQMEIFSKGYEDYLQSPLQPLMDNLDSQTYEIFEKDPFKYTQYEKAIKRALVHAIPEQKRKTKTVVITVVGAGRGPLVDAVLKAADSCRRKVKIFAVEKNPGALVTLLNRQVEEWDDKVTVVSCDMRQWESPVKADILVSELLGSFGDNELSPECLDGAQSFLKSDGISIPSSYTSFVAPLSSAKLHMEVANVKDKEKAYPHANFETPYVVRLHNADVLAEPQSCFTFTHPNKEIPINNERYVSLTFAVREASVLHGFAGYFDSVLYEDLHMSIHPHSHSEGMISWFPIFFPLKVPVYLDAGCKIVFHMWRLTNEKKVWYEWCVSSPRVTEVHNPGGRSYWIGL